MTASNGELASQLAAARGWDNLLRQLMLAGKCLHALPVDARTDDTEVKGCQSRVWLRLLVNNNSGGLSMLAWSDSKIIRGVLAVIQEKVNQLNVRELAVFDFNGWFTSVQLERYLSESRANGIAEVIRQIRLQSAQG